ncbi:unnamed protein product [Prorocentrum cordatum]|uniref:Uncharacterized protein n=1 Tax=Prorocentrum cordatum TaxID=2364126 RepID=A0ABN9XAX8_9DINO|nr:unnamed protein product [Polarella glacialis]
MAKVEVETPGAWIAGGQQAPVAPAEGPEDDAADGWGDALDIGLIASEDIEPTGALCEGGQIDASADLAAQGGAGQAAQEAECAEEAEVEALGAGAAGGRQRPEAPNDVVEEEQVDDEKEGGGWSDLLDIGVALAEEAGSAEEAAPEEADEEKLVDGWGDACDLSLAASDATEPTGAVAGGGLIELPTDPPGRGTTNQVERGMDRPEGMEADALADRTAEVQQGRDAAQEVDEKAGDGWGDAFDVCLIASGADEPIGALVDSRLMDTPMDPAVRDASGAEAATFGARTDGLQQAPEVPEEVADETVTDGLGEALDPGPAADKGTEPTASLVQSAFIEMLSTQNDNNNNKNHNSLTDMPTDRMAQGNAGQAGQEVRQAAMDAQADAPSGGTRAQSDSHAPMEAEEENVADGWGDAFDLSMVAGETCERPGALARDSLIKLPTELGFQDATGQVGTGTDSQEEREAEALRDAGTLAGNSLIELPTDLADQDATGQVEKGAGRHEEMDTEALADRTAGEQQGLVAAEEAIEEKVGDGWGDAFDVCLIASDADLLTDALVDSRPIDTPLDPDEQDAAGRVEQSTEELVAEVETPVARTVGNQQASQAIEEIDEEKMTAGWGGALDVGLEVGGGTEPTSALPKNVLTDMPSDLSAEKAEKAEEVEVDAVEPGTAGSQEGQREKRAAAEEVGDGWGDALDLCLIPGEADEPEGAAADGSRIGEPLGLGAQGASGWPQVEAEEAEVDERARGHRVGAQERAEAREEERAEAPEEEEVGDGWSDALDARLTARGAEDVPGPSGEDGSVDGPTDPGARECAGPAPKEAERAEVAEGPGGGAGVQRGLETQDGAEEAAPAGRADAIDLCLVAGETHSLSGPSFEGGMVGTPVGLGSQDAAGQAGREVGKAEDVQVEALRDVIGAQSDSPAPRVADKDVAGEGKEAAAEDAADGTGPRGGRAAEAEAEGPARVREAEAAEAGPGTQATGVPAAGVAPGEAEQAERLAAGRGPEAAEEELASLSLELQQLRQSSEQQMAEAETQRQALQEASKDAEAEVASLRVELQQLRQSSEQQLAKAEAQRQALQEASKDAEAEVASLRVELQELRHSSGQQLAEAEAQRQAKHEASGEAESEVASLRLEIQQLRQSSEQQRVEAEAQIQARQDASKDAEVEVASLRLEMQQLRQSSEQQLAEAETQRQALQEASKDAEAEVTNLRVELQQLRQSSEQQLAETEAQRQALQEASKKAESEVASLRVELQQLRQSSEQQLAEAETQRQALQEASKEAEAEVARLRLEMQQLPAEL